MGMRRIRNDNRSNRRNIGNNSDRNAVGGVAMEIGDKGKEEEKKEGEWRYSISVDIDNNKGYSNSSEGDRYIELCQGQIGHG